MIIPLIFAYLILILLGFSLWCFLGKDSEKKARQNPLKIVAVSFGIGMGVVYGILFGLSLLKISWSLLTVLIIGLVTIFILSLINFKKKKFILPQWKRTKITGFQTLLLGIIVVFLLRLLIEEFTAPIYGWDALSIWLLKARAFYVDSGVTYQFFQRGDLASFAHFEYPLLVPLSLDWFYLFLGFADRLWVRSLFFITYIILLIIFYLGVRKLWSRLFSLFWTLILASLPYLLEHAIHGAVGFADLTVAFYFLGSIFLYREKQEAAASLFLLFGALSKNEGIVFALVFGLLNLFFRKKWCYLGFFIPGVLPNFLWLKHVGVRQEYFSLFQKRDFLATLSLVLHHFREEFRKTKFWHLVFYIFGLASLLSIRKIVTSKETLIIYLSLLAQVSAYIFIYVITPQEPALQMATSLSRLVLQITPLSLFMGLIQLKEWYNEYYTIR